MPGNSDKHFNLYEKERKKVDKKLGSLLTKRKPASLYQPGSYILESSGKRLRPLLVLFSGRAVRGKLEKAYNAAMAVELLHNFTLVHDDIMDNADMRRGLATLHKKYDTNTAILAGDGLLSVAYECLIKDISNSNSKNILAAFTKGLVEVCEGQSLDKDYELREIVSLKEYILMIRKKTAAMIEMCCTIGGLLGGGSKKEIQALSKFGKNIGIAFQIQDDLLDIVGDQKKFGKLVGGDLIEGKKTFLLVKSLELAKGKDKAKLLKVIKNKGIRKNQVNEYKELYNKLGVIEVARDEIKRYTKNAMNQVKKLKRKSDRELFNWVADFLLSRKK